MHKSENVQGMIEIARRQEGNHLFILSSSDMIYLIWLESSTALNALNP